MSLKFFSSLQDFLTLYDTAATGFVAPPPQQQPTTSRAINVPQGRARSGAVSENGTPPSPKHSYKVVETTTDVLSSSVPLSPGWVVFDEDESREEKRKKKQNKSVTFPSDDSNLISSRCEPRRPIFHTRKTGEKVILKPQEVLQDYVTMCRKLKVSPSSKLETQISFFHHLANVRQETLSLKGEKVSHAHMECLEEIFRRVQFDLLDFEYCFLDDECLVALAEMLDFYDSAVKLNLSFNQRIGLRGWQALFKLVKNSPCLEHVNLRYTSINDRSIPLMARALRCEPTLNVLHLENCSLSSKSMLLLVCSLKANNVLKELYMGENNLGPNDCAHLYQLITGNSSIQLLDLRNNNIQDAGLQHICDALSDSDSYQNGSLSTLVLWNNRLTPNGMDYIRAALRVNTRLETLNLGCNNVGSVGVELLKDSLTRNRTLLRIGLQATKLNCQAAIALAECIADNPTLLRIDLRDNPDIRSAGLLALHLAMKMNNSVTTLNLDKTVCYANNKVKEYSDQFKRCYDEIVEFCERNRLSALEKSNVCEIEDEATTSSDETQTVTQPEATEPDGVPPSSSAAAAVVRATSDPVKVESKSSKMPPRSLSLTCQEPVSDFLDRLAAMPREEIVIKRQEVIYESSDEEDTKVMPVFSKVLPSLSASLPSSASSALSSLVERFSVSHVTSLSTNQRSSSLPGLHEAPPSPISSRFAVSPVTVQTDLSTVSQGPSSAPCSTNERPASLSFSTNQRTSDRSPSPTKRRGLKLLMPSTPTEPETDEQKLQAVQSVVLDLVNFCVYELGDFPYTPSVPRSKRAISDDFEQRTPKRTDSSSSAAQFELPSSLTVPCTETDEEVESAVSETVRYLVKSCMLTERDTLRRSLRKKRAKLATGPID